MMQVLLWLALAAVGFSVSAAPVNKSKSPSKKKTAATAAKSSSAAGRGAKTTNRQQSASRSAPRKKPAPRASTKSAGKRATKVSSARRRRSAIPSFRAGQQKPTPDRVRDIQSALIARGYMQGEADGNWGGSTVDALKRFQQDQNLSADGKLTSLSLIALGLGPRRSGLASVPKPAAAPPPAPAELPAPPLPPPETEPR